MTRIQKHMQEQRARGYQPRTTPPQREGSWAEFWERFHKEFTPEALDEFARIVHEERERDRERARRSA